MLRVPDRVTSRSHGRRGAAIAHPIVCVLALAVIALGSACSSPEQQAADHLERGRAFLEEGNREAALIEFNNALRLDASNPNACIELANIKLSEGNTRDAIVHFRDALRIRPNDGEVAISLALLLRSDEPEEARRIIDAVLEREPDNALAHAASSQIHQALGEFDAGHTDALRAVEIAPDQPSLQWQLGLSAQAMVFRAAKTRSSAPDELFEVGQAAFDRFVALGGEPAWKAHLEKARLLASWAGHREEAAAELRLAIDAASELDDDAMKLHAADMTGSLARSMRDKGVYADALEIFVSLNPDELVEWINLAELRQASGGSANAVYQEMLARLPNDPEAHIQYAGYVARNIGLYAALEILDRQAETGKHPARMLSAKRNLELSTGMNAQAARTLKRMQRDFPDDPWTIIEEAQAGFQMGLAKMSIARLRDLVVTDEIPEAFELLARAELTLGNVEGARYAAQKAVEVVDRFDPKAERVLAEVMYATGDYEGAMAALERLDARTTLVPMTRLLLAQTHYELGQADEGREILISLMDENPRWSEAVAEYARREAANPMQRDLVQKRLLHAFQLDPTDSTLLTLLINSDLDFGRQSVALERLNRIDVKKHPPEIALLRARLRADENDVAGAIEDAEFAFAFEPDLPKLVDLLATLHLKNQSLDEAVVQITKRVGMARRKFKRGKLNDFERTKLAWNQILLSRYLVADGRPGEAIETLERSINDGDAILATNLELAFLLARAGEHLDRAEVLAKSVIAQQRRNALAYDTLGFIQLNRENHEKALRSFKSAIRFSTQPQPIYYYHEFVALENLGRNEEALASIESVLALDPQYPGALANRERIRARIHEVDAPSEAESSDS